MMDILEELLAKLFGAKQEQPIPVRVDDRRPQDKQIKGRK